MDDSPPSSSTPFHGNATAFKSVIEAESSRCLATIDTKMTTLVSDLATNSNDLFELSASKSRNLARMKKALDEIANDFIENVTGRMAKFIENSEVCLSKSEVKLPVNSVLPRAGNCSSPETICQREMLKELFGFIEEGRALEEVQSLIVRGVDVNGMDADGWTPLLLVAEGERKELVHLLLHCGADVHCQDPCKKTLLHYAAEYGWTDIVKLLIEHSVDLDVRDSNGDTPLLMAARWKRKEVVHFLMRSGADVQCQCCNEMSLLHHAAVNGWADIVESLTEHSVHLDRSDIDGDTPLLLAGRFERKEVVDLLMRRGARLQCRGRYEMTLLHHAAVNGWTDIVKKLTECSVCLNARDSNGYTPLLLAARFERKAAVHLLIRSGADVHCRDPQKQTVLHYSAINGWENTIQLLNDYKINVNARDYLGNTALHLAVTRNSRGTIVTLMEAGANWNVANDKSKTPLFTLLEKGFMDIVRQGILMGAYVGSIQYKQLFSLLLFRNKFLRDEQLCSLAIINKFNSSQLPILYSVVNKSLLPPHVQMEIVKGDSWEALEVRRAVSRQIEMKGYCCELNTRPMILGMLCVKSFVDYVDSVRRSKEGPSSSTNYMKRSNPGGKGGSSCKKIRP